MNRLITHTVRVVGKGHSKEDALARALGQIQKNVSSELKGMIIRIEPLDVEIVEAVEQEFTERFMFFFFPRKRTLYYIKADVKVQLAIIDMEKVVFEKRISTTPPIKQLYKGSHNSR